MTRRLKYLLPPIIWLTAQTALASGIQVSPTRLDFSVAGGGATSQNLTVVNPTSDVQLFEVYPDDFTELIQAEPRSFTLEAGAKKIVTVTAQAKTGDAQTLATSLSVVGKPLSDNQNFSVGTGVKIPLSITQTAQTYPSNRQKQTAELLLAVAITIVGLWTIYIHKTKKLPV